MVWLLLMTRISYVMLKYRENAENYINLLCYFGHLSFFVNRNRLLTVLCIHIQYTCITVYYVSKDQRYACGTGEDPTNRSVQALDEQ